MKVPGKARRTEIDFVRGIAIIMVMAIHFREPLNTGMLLPDAFKNAMESFGGHGVTLFFVLSGFLVGGLLLKEYKDTSTLRPGRFLVRRMFKIWPSFYVLLLIHAVLRRHPFHTFFWQNFFHLQNYLGTTIAQTWSLAVEEHFYLLLPLVMGLMVARKFTPKQMLITLSGISAISFTWRAVDSLRPDFNAIQHYTQYNVDSLLCGVIIALLYHFMPEVYGRLTRRAWPLLLWVAFGVGSTYLPRAHWQGPFILVTAYTASAAFLLLMMEHSGRLVKTWLYRAVATIGVYSYGIYLYHSWMLGTGEKIVARFTHYPDAWTVAHTYANLNEARLGWFVAFGAQFAGAIVLGVVMTRLVEWPFLMWRERIKALGDRKPLLAAPNEGELDPVVELTGQAKATM